ncbi:hypothetical protein L6452_09336 [Arctium lappa]|uniref:Uncharacterized protein n=1 Tax=Arctium lappa TaxID=4217 RepID=A0ACB9DJR2_ARCLA|nr:hypothetical protein L6452_09336 [Arctium lappa]
MSNEDDPQIILNDAFNNVQGEKMPIEDNLKNISNDAYDGEQHNQDETCKLNYKAFGDVVSFDATFKKNKYNMVFVPFTGIDNHQKCVIFGAGMLSDEKKEPYMWLLNAFLSVHGSEPNMVITDQDLGMKATIEVVFKSAKHRLCMWHIMNKLPSKIGSQINEDVTIKKEKENLRFFLMRKIIP